MHAKLLILLLIIAGVGVYSDSYLKLSNYSNNAFWEFIRQQRQTCDPNEACKTGAQGDKVPDPLECHNFYVCVLVDGELVSSSQSIPCSEGTYFNSTVSECVDEIEPCTTVSCGGEKCSLECNGTYDLVGKPGDCNKYYICLAGGQKVEATCPDNAPYFNGDDCTASSPSCCNFCSPSCSEIGLQIQDPNDCRKYYICIEVGTPGEEVHLDCPSGQIFDPEIGGCIEGSTCTSLCSSSSTTVAGGSTTAAALETTTGAEETTTVAMETTTAERETTSTSTEVTSTTSTTSTTSLTTTTFETTSTANICNDHFTCTEAGYFPRCDYCYESYYKCTSAGSVATILTCEDGTVFNPVPEYPFCIDPDVCPYYP